MKSITTSTNRYWINLAIITWLTGNEERGLRFAIIGFLLSVIALQKLIFISLSFQ